MWLPFAAVTLFHFQSSRLKLPAYREFNRLEYSLKILYFMNSLVNPIDHSLHNQSARVQKSSPENPFKFKSYL